MMHALFHEAGISQRADRLAITGDIIGRVVLSSNDLSRAEMSVLLDRLATPDVSLRDRDTLRVQTGSP
jgi:hypothetical protein